MESITLEEKKVASRKRTAIIKKEFKRGFKFLENIPKSVSFFGSSRFKEDNHFYKHARILGNRIASELKYAVVTGGGPGIMEAANRGAFEVKGVSLGLTIDLPHGQKTNGYLTNQIDFYYFFSRKVFLSFAAEAYVFYPGGFGTLDECFEILTLVQTNKISPVPIILAGSEYWNKFDSLIKEMLLEKFEAISPGDQKIYTITDDHNEMLEIIKNAPIREGLKCCGEV